MIRFDSWAAVLAYAQTGADIWYHAPFDVYPTRFRYARSTRIMMGGEYRLFGRNKEALRIMSLPADADVFIADAGHLDRFRRPEVER